jgi:hypothetical protein
VIGERACRAVGPAEAGERCAQDIGNTFVLKASGVFGWSAWFAEQCLVCRDIGAPALYREAVTGHSPGLKSDLRFALR